MPFASRLGSTPTLTRLFVLSALTFGLVATTTGVASADTTAPTSGTTVTDPTDPGTTPTDPTGITVPTDPTITFSLPAVANARQADLSGAARTRARIHAVHALEVHAVLKVARNQHGKPYVYGGAGPRSFDCSGLVRYVFGHAVHRWLPHNAAAQYQSVQHIKRRNLQAGDLVFQESGGYPFHVGIYAGHGKWWHAPHSGSTVRKQTIYRGHLYYGRVLTTGMAKHRK